MLVVDVPCHMVQSCDHLSSCYQIFTSMLTPFDVFVLESCLMAVHSGMKALLLPSLSFFILCKRECIKINEIWGFFLSFGELHDHYSNSFPTELRYIPMSRNGGIETQLFPIPSAFPALHICDALNICLCYADTVQYSP